MVKGKSGLVSTACTCAKILAISWGIVYHHWQIINLYRIAPKHVCLKLIPQKMQVKVRTLIKCSSLLFVVLEREISCWKQSSWMWSNVSTMLEMYSCGYPRDIRYETLLFVYNYKHSDSGTSSGCSIVLVVSPLVSLMMDQVASLRSCGVSAALVWLFLHITTMCNLSIIGLIHRRFP